jgi:aspartyl-tRNA(Asn)/glutamyl-tRNA(Gln) amidotransferase subunit B
MHTEGADTSLVDYNRSGTPLLEIVSEPDISSPEEAYWFLTALKSILKYLDVSDCNMEEGSLRCDANVSIRPRGQKELGVKTELKNMNSFKGVRTALEYEVTRQEKILREGGSVSQETRLWSEAQSKTLPMRSKEEAFDYRYFPEPDLVPFTIGADLIDSVKKTIPELPEERLGRFEREYRLAAPVAFKLVSDRRTADLFEEAVKDPAKAQAAANWITEDISAEANRRGVTIPELGILPSHITELVDLIDSGIISGKIAKSVIPEMIETKKGPREIVGSKGLSQIQDKTEILKAVDAAIKANPKPAEDFRGGKTAALAFLVGEVMKATRGKANPKLVNELLRERIET